MCPKAELVSPEYAFEIGSATSEGANRHKILKYYKEQQLQFFVTDSSSGMELCSGKIDYEQLLYYSAEGEQKREQWVEKVALFAIENSSQLVGFMHVELSNSLCSIASQHRHKNTVKMSLEPMTVEIGGNTYINSSLGVTQGSSTVAQGKKNDKESRIINRINSYKNAQSNVLLRPEREGGDSSNTDKNLLLHRKRRELEKIHEFKQTTKDQYMSKIFNEAIETYHTDSCELAECKYVCYRYANTTGRHQRVRFACLHVTTAQG